MRDPVFPRGLARRPPRRRGGFDTATASACGELSIEQTTQIRSLPIWQLENLGEALLDFTGMADLELWLKAHVGE
jgi:Domain of unknown function (DUF4351)